MANLAPATNVSYAACITAIVVGLLQVLQANGIVIPEGVMATLPAAVPILVAYLHDVATGGNKPPA